MKITESQFNKVLDAYKEANTHIEGVDEMRAELNRLNIKVMPDSEMIEVNGITLPAPERTEPALGTSYYVAVTSADSPRKWKWNDTPSDHQWLADGIVYLKKKHAEAARAAMLRPFIKE